MYSGTKIAKASHLRPYTREDSSLIEGKGTHPITQISLIQRREKCYPREEKGALPQWSFPIQARSLKDHVRKPYHPRTQILDLRTQIELIYHSFVTFIRARRKSFHYCSQLFSPKRRAPHSTATQRVSQGLCSETLDYKFFFLGLDRPLQAPRYGGHRPLPTHPSQGQQTPTLHRLPPYPIQPYLTLIIASSLLGVRRYSLPIIHRASYRPKPTNLSTD